MAQRNVKPSEKLKGSVIGDLGSNTPLPNELKAHNALARV